MSKPAVHDINPFMKLLPHQIECTPDNQTARKVEKLCTLLIDDLANHREEHKFERTLILCKSTKSCRTATVALLSKRIHNWIMTEDMIEDKESFAAHKKKFVDGEERIGMCTVEALMKADLPLIKHYIVMEMPKKLHRLHKQLKYLEETAEQKQRPIRIDFLTSNLASSDEMRCWLMELDTRGFPLPQWLLQAVISLAPPEEPTRAHAEESQVLNATSAQTSGGPVVPLARFPEMKTALSQIADEVKQPAVGHQVPVDSHKKQAAEPVTVIQQAPRIQQTPTTPVQVIPTEPVIPTTSSQAEKQVEVDSEGRIILPAECFNYDDMDDDDYELADGDSDDYDYEQIYEYGTYDGDLDYH